jgi:hypothetical protein|tara:strand:+ start:1680 stop:2249 length:570 start_codon:yes stop_codon:yes gene_type:complete
MKITNTIKITKLLAILFISVFTFTACSDDDDDDHDHDSEEELITTVNYTLTSGSDVVTLKFSDPDGDGAIEPIYEVSGDLTANSTYTGIIELLNETESPVEDITEEVKEEADEHEFFYTSDVSGLAITKTDVDGNDNPLGIETSVTTGEAGSGTLTIVLKHEPTKPNDGSSSSAGGSTDVEITFDVTIN